MEKNVPTSAQLYSSHMPAKSCWKFSKLDVNSMWMENFQMFKQGSEKEEESEIKLPIFAGSSKKQESSRKTSTSALLTVPKPLANHNERWKILKEMGIPDHLISLLWNLYAGQEAAVRDGTAKTDWFQIGKGISQGCILLPCLFNLYVENVMRSAGLDEIQAQIKRLPGEI